VDWDRSTSLRILEFPKNQLKTKGCRNDAFLELQSVAAPRPPRWRNLIDEETA
jgi:hypothetical protein